MFHSFNLSKSSLPASDAEPMLRKIFIDEINDIYWAEKYLVKTLPKIRKAATSIELSALIEGHIEVAQIHVKRLKQVFDLLGERVQTKKGEVMEALVDEGKSFIDDTREGSFTRDAVIVSNARKLEQHAIAAYESLMVLAVELKWPEIENMLAIALNEEKNTDDTLVAIAEDINHSASREEE